MSLKNCRRSGYKVTGDNADAMVGQVMADFNQREPAFGLESRAVAPDSIPSQPRSRCCPKGVRVREERRRRLIPSIPQIVDSFLGYPHACWRCQMRWLRSSLPCLRLVLPDMTPCMLRFSLLLSIATELGRPVSAF